MSDEYRFDDFKSEYDDIEDPKIKHQRELFIRNKKKRERKFVPIPNIKETETERERERSPIQRSPSPNSIPKYITEKTYETLIEKQKKDYSNNTRETLCVGDNIIVNNELKKKIYKDHSITLLIEQYNELMYKIIYNTMHYCTIEYTDFISNGFFYFFSYINKINMLLDTYEDFVIVDSTNVWKTMNNGLPLRNISDLNNEINKKIKYYVFNKKMVNINDVCHIFCKNSYINDYRQIDKNNVLMGINKFSMLNSNNLYDLYNNNNESDDILILILFEYLISKRKNVKIMSNDNYKWYIFDDYYSNIEHRIKYNMNKFAGKNVILNF